MSDEHGSPYADGVAIGRAEALEQIQGELQIANGWLATNEVEDFGYGVTGPAEPIPLVNLRTLPGWDELRDLVVAKIPPLAAGELYRLAQTVQQMPPPRGDQPREFGLTVRVPRLNAEVVLGDVIWNPSILEWTLRIAPPTIRNAEALDYPFREMQTPPEGTVARRDS